MGKLLAIVLLFAAAGIPAYIMVRGSVVDFDVTSSEHPLGTMVSVDGWLKENGFETETRGKPRGKAPEGTKTYRYKETYAGDSGQFLCYVEVCVDSGDRVRQLLVEFPSRSREVDPAYTKAQGLSYSLWNKLAGAPPAFGDDPHPPVGDTERGLRSDLDRAQVTASWVKAYTDRDRVHSIVDTVTFRMK